MEIFKVGQSLVPKNWADASTLTKQGTLPNQLEQHDAFKAKKLTFTITDRKQDEGRWLVKVRMPNGIGTTYPGSEGHLWWIFESDFDKFEVVEENKSIDNEKLNKLSQELSALKEVMNKTVKDASAASYAKGKEEAEKAAAVAAGVIAKELGDKVNKRIKEIESKITEQVKMESKGPKKEEKKMAKSRGSMVERLKSNAHAGTKLAIARKATKIVKSGCLRAVQAGLDSKNISKEKAETYLEGAKLFLESDAGTVFVGMLLSLGLQNAPIPQIQNNEYAQDVFDFMQSDSIAKAGEMSLDLLVAHIAPGLLDLFQGASAPPVVVTKAKKRVKVSEKLAEVNEEEVEAEEVAPAKRAQA